MAKSDTVNHADGGFQAGSLLDLIWDWQRWPRQPRAMQPDAILERAVPTHQRLYWPLGEPLLFQTDEPDLLAVVDETFGRFPSLLDDGRPPLIVRIFVHGVPSLAADARAEIPPTIYRTHGHLLYVSIGAGNTAVADLVHGRAFGFITPSLACNSARFRDTFFHSLAFSLLATTRGFASFHAACLVKDGVGAILGGGAGAGKSTLAFAWARRGHQILAEDALFVGRRGGRARLWGLPWKLHLLPESRRLFPELEAEDPRLQVNGEWKLEVELEAYHPGSAVTNAAPGPIFLLERRQGGGVACIEPLSPANLRAGFRDIWPWWAGWTDELAQRVEGLLAGGAFRLWTNDDPYQAVDALENWLDGHRDRPS
jgi:hypothetical protein